MGTQQGKTGTKMTRGSTLSKGRVEEFRSRLLEMRRRMTGEFDHMVENVREEINPGGNLSNAPVHMGDMASDRINADIDVLETETVMLDDIDQALRRIEDGSFGICVDCEQPIREERLDVLPYASRCIGCAEKSER